MIEENASRQAYLDTSVISGLANNDMKSSDSLAFQKIVQMAQNKDLFLCASTVAREEIEKIPDHFRDKHMDIYKTLIILHGSVTSWIDEDPLSTGYRQNKQDLDFIKLQKILPHVNDARHLFQAKKAGINEIITADYHSILVKANELEIQCGLKVFSPSDFLKSLST